MNEYHVTVQRNPCFILWFAQTEEDVRREARLMGYRVKEVELVGPWNRQVLSPKPVEVV